MRRLRRPAAAASRHRPPAAVVRVAMLSVALPVGLLLWMVATVVVPHVSPAVVLIATGAVAAWGARVGVLGGRGPGLLRRGAVVVARWSVLLGVAAVVRIASSGTADDLVGVDLVVPGVLVVLGFLAGRSIGRIHRRQADPLAGPGEHSRADAALMAAVLVGVVATTTVAVLAWAGDAPWTPSRWTLPMWLAVATAALVSGRPAMLRARSGTSPSASGGWFNAALPLAGAVVALTLCVAVALSVGLETRLRDALPSLPSWSLDLFDPATDRAAPPPPTWEESTADVVWQIVLLVAIFLLTVGRVARRRLRRYPYGPGLSLRMLLQALLGRLRSGRVVADDEERDPDGAVEAVADAPLAARVPAWVQRFRRRPRDPAAAILHDYHVVQRRLPGPRRRRPSETVLAHAEREHTADLAELADMVCAIRFAERTPTAEDAERSRLLARRLTHG